MDQKIQSSCQSQQIQVRQGVGSPAERWVFPVKPPHPVVPSLFQAMLRSQSPMAGGQVTPTPSSHAGPAGALKGQQGPGARLPSCFEANPCALCMTAPKMAN